MRYLLDSIPAGMLFAFWGHLLTTTHPLGHATHCPIILAKPYACTIVV